MPAAGAVLIVAVVLIVLALVYYLVSTILALRQITDGLDEVIASVGEIVEKSAPVKPVVADINENLDAAVGALEGLLVKKAGMERRGRPRRRAVPRSRRRGLPRLPGEPRDHAAADRRGLHQGHADARPARPRGADRMANPAGPVLRNVECGSLAARLLYPNVRQEAPGEPPAVPGHRRRLAGPVRGARGHRKAAQADEERLMQTPAPFGYERATSLDGAIASLQRLGSEARSSPAGTACCR